MQMTTYAAIDVNRENFKFFPSRHKRLILRKRWSRSFTNGVAYDVYACPAPRAIGLHNP